MVWYGIDIRLIIICEEEILADFNLMVVKVDCQTATFYSLPNFQVYGNYQ